jgi:hypothetical protein
MSEPTSSMRHDQAGTAFHEAGHAAASFLLNVAIREVSIIPRERDLGHLSHYRPRGNLEARMIEADYDSGYGGFIDSRLRRWVENHVMILLAGGLTEIEMTGAEDHEVGMGLVRLAQEGEILNEIVGGDLLHAWDLVERVSGGDDEAAAYFDWLYQRTHNLMRDPRFQPCVEAVAAALLQKRRLSGRSVRATIDGAIYKHHSGEPQ